MTDPNELRALVQEEIAVAVAPLRAELDRFRDELAALRGGAREVPAAAAAAGHAEAPSPEPIPSPPAAPAPVASPLPAERSDFARMLQRGLEAEARESRDEKDAPPPARKGWNPFRR